MANLIGAVPLRINQKYIVTVTQWQRDINISTKVHSGGYGNFGTSRPAGEQISGSFKVSVPEAGFEFNWRNEFSKPGASIVAEFPNKLGFTGVALSADSIAVDEAQGNTEQTIRWTAEHEINL